MSQHSLSFQLCLLLTVGHKRRAISQERWPSSVTSITTPPPTLRRHQIQYHSQRVTRGHNITYRYVSRLDIILPVLKLN